MKVRSDLPKGEPGTLKIRTVYLSPSLTQKICGLLSGLGQCKEIFWGLSFGSEMLLIPGGQNVTGLSSKSRGTMEVM